MFNEYLEVNTGEDQKITISAQFAKTLKNLFLLITGWQSIKEDIKNL